MGWLPIEPTVAAFVIVRGAITMALYLCTQNSIMPFVVWVLAGAILQTVMSADAKVVMVLTMVYLGAGILTKTWSGDPEHETKQRHDLQN